MKNDSTKKDEELDFIKELYDVGFGISAIASALHVSRTTVKNHLIAIQVNLNRKAMDRKRLFAAGFRKWIFFKDSNHKPYVELRELIEVLLGLQELRGVVRTMDFVADCFGRIAFTPEQKPFFNLLCDMYESLRPFDDLSYEKYDYSLLLSSASHLWSCNLAPMPTSLAEAYTYLAQCAFRYKNSYDPLIDWTGSKLAEFEMKKVLKTLAPQEESIIRAAYGIGTDLTSKADIAKQHGVGTKDISKMIVKALRELQNQPEFYFLAGRNARQKIL